MQSNSLLNASDLSDSVGSPKPFSFVLELRGQKFRSKREPKHYEELVQAATSLLDNQRLILGCLPMIGGGNGGGGNGFGAGSGA